MAVLLLLISFPLPIQVGLAQVEAAKAEAVAAVSGHHSISLDVSMHELKFAALPG